MSYLGASVFHKDKKKAPMPLSQVKSKNIDKLSRCLVAKQLIITEKRTEMIKPYRSLMGLADDKYDALCEGLLLNLAAYLQDLPETRNSYFSSRGGFLNHALSRCTAALSACRAYFVNDEGKPAKTLSNEQQLWMYALFTAALLKGIGKLYVDFIVELFDKNGDFIKQWDVFDGPMKEQGAHFYDYDFAAPHQEIFRHRVTLLLAKQILPKAGYLWLASDKDVLSIWLALLEDDSRSGGTLGMILDKADALVINRYFQEHGHTGYQQDGDIKSFQQRNTTFSVPQKEVADILKQGDIPQAGIEFVKWLSRSLLTAKLMVNQAPLFMVPGGLLMSPDIFQMFIREHPEFKSWQSVQTAFEQMQLHTTGANGEVQQRFVQTKTGQKQTGVVLSHLNLVLPENVKVVNMSTGAVKEISATNLASAKMSSSNFAPAMPPRAPEQTLSQTGQWETPKNGTQSPAVNPKNPTQKG